MSNRQQTPITTTRGYVAVVTSKGWLSGSGGDMTGSLTTAAATDLKFTAVYGSSSLGLPSGSVQLQLPANNIYRETLYWAVSVEASGALIGAPAGQGTTGVSPYSVVKYGHNTLSGTFSFGIVQNSGSAGGSSADVNVGTVPVDKSHPSSPVLEWTLVAVVVDEDKL